MFLNLVQQLASFGGIKLHHPAGAAQRNDGLIWTDVGGKHRVVFLAEGHQLFSGNDVPNDNSSGFRALATDSNEKLGVVAEFQIHRLALAEWKNSQQFVRFSMKKKDLLLTGNSHNRRPGTGSQTQERSNAGSMDDAFEGQALRHRGWPLGLTQVLWFERQVKTRFHHRNRFASGTLEQAPKNPLFEHLQFFVRELGTIRRHKGFLCVRECLPKFAPVHVARSDDSAGTAPLQRALIAG